MPKPAGKRMFAPTLTADAPPVLVALADAADPDPDGEPDEEPVAVLAAEPDEAEPVAVLEATGPDTVPAFAPLGRLEPLTGLRTRSVS